MKSLTRYLTFNVPERVGLVNITLDVARTVTESGVQVGLVPVNATHA